MLSTMRTTKGRDHDHHCQPLPALRGDIPRIPVWAGVNHRALITADLDATVPFYDGVLCAPLVATIADDRMRHVFFRFGEHCTIAFSNMSATRSRVSRRPRASSTPGRCTSTTSP